VLEQDASVVVARAAERAAREAALPAKERAAAHRPGGKGGGHAHDEHALEVTEVTVLPAGEEPSVGEDVATGTATELFPGIRDEHDDDDGGWQARWLERPTWDRSVTPNIRRRTGQRPPRRTRGYG
jgi:hypothetical protein